MIRFKKLRFKNFLSYGNAFVEIDFESADSTLVIGKNGEGKSTMMDALTFVLFGKPFRKIKLPQLINTINGKDCLVEVEFVTNNSTYTVRRGIKPGVFEVLFNGVLLNQDSKNRDYQKILETQILKFNYRSFTQIVVLGSAKFQPFMQLPTFARREIIEDLLDLSIFSVMADEIKQTISNQKGSLTDLNGEILVLRQSIRDNQDFISHIESNKDSQIKEFYKDLEDTEKKISELTDSLTAHEAWMEENVLSDEKLERAKNQISEWTNEICQMEREIEKSKKEAGFYQKNDTCPTCSQEIDHDFKQKKLTCIHVEEQTTLEKKEDLQRKRDTLASQYQKKLTESLEAKEAKMKYLSDSSNLSKYTSKLKQKIRELESKEDVSYKEYQDKLEALTNSLNEFESKYKKGAAKLKYYELCLKLSSDSGIKSKIISTYIPTFNSLVNKYLSLMDFYVSFYLDENFDETIKSRYRDTFSYSSFSEGEKLRIDLALLFTWREVSKLKNSTSTNIIIMDEITDSSMDAEGVRDFTAILKAFDPNVKVFIISHNDKMRDKFDRTLLAEKVGNFSTLREI